MHGRIRRLASPWANSCALVAAAAFLLLAILVNAGAIAAASTGGSKKRSPSAMRTLGDQAFVKRDYKKALAAYGEAIKLEPANERNYMRRFRVFLRQAKYARAAKDLSKAVAANPKYGKGFFERAKVRVKTGACEAAVADFDRAAGLLTAKSKDAAAIPGLRARAAECATHAAAAHRLLASRAFPEAKDMADKALHVAVASSGLQMLRARALWHGKALRVPRRHGQGAQARAGQHRRARAAGNRVLPAQ